MVRLPFEAFLTAILDAPDTAPEGHDTYYHITDDPHFAPDAHRVPSDNTFAMHQRTEPGLYATQDVESWANGQGYKRPYVAELHVPHEVGRAERWGGEKFIPGADLDKVRVRRVIPLDEHVRETFGGPGWIESYHGTATDGQKIPRTEGGFESIPGHTRGEPYHYTGPDVRDMTPEQHQQHYHRWKQFLVGGGNGDASEPFKDDDFDDKKMTLRTASTMHPMTFEAFSATQFRKVAHDSGDGETIFHCPFCGSGQVIANSDRTISCEFCHTNFTVQVQPVFSAFPQTIDGQPVQVPGMPGQVGVEGPPMDPNAEQLPPGADPGDPDQEDPQDPDQEGGAPQKGVNPFASSLRTAAGRPLSQPDYLARLALAHSGDREQTLAHVRHLRSA